MQKRPTFPKIPANVKVYYYNLRHLIVWKQQYLKFGSDKNYSRMRAFSLQPVGYWGSPITVRERRDGEYEVTYASGGTDGTVSNQVEIDNFIDGLKVAQKLAIWLQEYHTWVEENPKATGG